MIAAIVVLLPFLLSLSCSVPGDGRGGEESGLWPQIEPYREGYLQVSDLHSIHYRICGNPGGIPVFVLHGGPGAGCYPYYRRFFNPEKYMIVLHDQRGCGRSTPYLETRDNTTWDLVDDIERLRGHLGIDKMILFGGSWGTTLALAYGEEHPANVMAMVLRGVFLATDQEIEHYYHGGVRHVFPEAYDRLEAKMKEVGKMTSPEDLFELIAGEDGELSKEYAIAWVEYESAISRLIPEKSTIREGWENNENFRRVIHSMGLLENYYMANRCFLDEGQLLANAHRIAGIPTYIINGRYDMVCPPLNAYLLHSRLDSSSLVFTEAGHSMGERETEKELLRTMKEMEDLF